MFLKMVPGSVVEDVGLRLGTRFKGCRWKCRATLSVQGSGFRVQGSGFRVQGSAKNYKLFIIHFNHPLFTA